MGGSGICDDVLDEKTVEDLASVNTILEVGCGKLMENCVQPVIHNQKTKEI